MRKMESSQRDENQRLSRRCRGFSLIELVVVVTILLIVTAYAAPNFINMIRTSRLRGSASDFGGVAQLDRLRSVQDGQYYSVKFAGNQAYVDVNNNGLLDPTEPSITLSEEVAPVSAVSAPNTANLRNQYLPVGSTLVPSDGGPTSGTPITFSSRGLPCKTQNVFGFAASVCDSAGGAIAFWVFFRDTITGQYEAVTVTPAGRIRKWFYMNGAWAGN